MNPTHKANFYNYYSSLVEVIHQKELKCLYSDNDTINGINVLELTPINSNAHSDSHKKFNEFINCWDLINCSADLRMVTAELFLLSPFINDPTKEFYQMNNHLYLPTYFQNKYDSHYSTCISIAFEKLYNYWDRIGDTLAYHLPTGLREIEINFSKVIERLKTNKNYNENEHFIWLKNFKENEFKEFNEYRKNIVHYYNYESYYRFYITGTNNPNKVIDLWKEKSNFPEYFKKHLDQENLGYFHLLSLLKDCKSNFITPE